MVMPFANSMKQHARMYRLFIPLSLFFAILIGSPKVRADGFVLNGSAYTVFNAPGAIATEPLAINDLGNIAGTYFDGANNAYGFSDVGGVFNSITYPGSGGETYVQGMNNEGQIVGTTSNNGSFLYSG